MTSFALKKPKTNQVTGKELQYLSGFGNHFTTEAIPNTLPKGQNSPQRVAHGLYAEQVSGSSFLSPRHENQRSWLYKIKPSVVHGQFVEIDSKLLKSDSFDPSSKTTPSPNQMRWDPFPIPTQPTDFIQGLITIAGSGGYGDLKGCATHIYACNQSMKDRYFYNSDGEFLFVPESGSLHLCTEFGVIDISPGEIAVIPRGVKYQVKLIDDTARGYICENFGQALRLPYLGPIGSNGLANPRDFQTPMAHFEESKGNFKLLCKFQGRLFEADIDHSPLNVVAWHGNYAPYKYDLSLFNVVNTVSFDHCDPSIFTVLTSPSEYTGLANVDFVIFPPRWMVAQNTFRPPYYHRNYMSEYMGLIFGVYDARQTGFVPGGGSLHNSMSAHGPDTETYAKASTQELNPVYLKDTLAFMFESRHVFRPTKFASTAPQLQKDYHSCWLGLKNNFSPE